MSIRPRLRAPAAALLGALALAGCAREPERPVNLLLITLDTLRADHLGCYGYERPTSPHLDRFAESATLFSDVTCSMPTTLPSHLTILTGLTPAQHGATRNGFTVQRDLLSVFELLEPLGLTSAAVVSAAVLQPKRLSVLGLDEHYYRPLGEDPHQIPGDVITDQALDWLAEKGDRPFALWLHYFDTHEPYRPPPAFAERFRRPYDGPLRKFLSIRWLSSLKDPAAVAKLTAADRRYIVDLYDAEIAFLDHQLGRLFDQLEESGRWRDTAVVVVGDHGQAHGENDRYGHGDWLLEPVVKVPLLIRLPGQARGRTVETPVETRDLVPTLAELFGTAPCTECRGRSLMKALRGEPIPPPAYRVVERRVFGGPDERRGLSIFRRDWKLTYYQEGEESLYHLGKTTGRGGLDGESFYDPEDPETARFEGLIEALRRREAEREALTEETQDMLRSLGYL